MKNANDVGAMAEGALPASHPHGFSTRCFQAHERLLARLRAVCERISAPLAQMDTIDRFAVTLLTSGLALVVWGLDLDWPGSLEALVRHEFGNWAPGLVIDGMLLWVVNSIFRRQERSRTLAQLASLSNEFALDAVRRSRDEGWLTDGSLRGRDLSKAALARADLADADLRGASLASVDLSDACLQHADLRETNLEGANLRNADLRWCRLTGASLRWADLRGAWLEGAWLEGVEARFAAVDARHAETGLLRGCIRDGYLQDRQISLIRESFEQLLALGMAPVRSFYEHLFQLAPEARPLFKGDIEAQARKFVHSLRVIIAGLECPEKHVAMLQRLGARHASFGVEPRHYAILQSALIGMLEDCLGAEFNDELRLSWQRAYELIASAMVDGSAERARRRSEAAAAPPITAWTAPPAARP